MDDAGLIAIGVFLLLSLIITNRFKHLGRPRRQKKVKGILEKRRKKIVDEYQKGRISYKQMQKKLNPRNKKI